MDNLTRAADPCSRCGAIMADGLCAACLLLAAAESWTRSTLDDALESRLDSGLKEGDIFGPYRIEHLLGRGGMGEVYEAEHLDSGRRVALKILRRRLQHPEDRARFFREGQLAASISHPHAVYIFGSEEIDGQPVITMELLPGGTLRDRVLAGGPLPIPEAVAAVMDIIGGLDAAHAVGILHRDVKPSNCFTDSDGAVKVGDFGLSISTLARDVRHEVADSGFQGTPQFAPPEQLRGEPLDVRADIYAVGATLFYLLVGRPPYEAASLRDLVPQVLDSPVPSLRALRPEVPVALARVVQACLTKDARGRPGSYSQLADQLRPFTRPAYQPAPLSQRFMAGIADWGVLSLLSLVAPVWWTWTSGDLNVDMSRGRMSVSVDFTTWLLSLAYYGALEGVFGASLGKRLFSLRVAAQGRRPTTGAMVRRLAVYHLPGLTFVLPSAILGRDATIDYLAAHPAVATLGSGVVLTLMATLFVTVRHNNGWAALHDLASGLRVVAAVEAPPARSRLQVPATMAVNPIAPAMRCGPFSVTADLGAVTGGRLLAGVDPLLRRNVWIIEVPPGTPPIAPSRRDVSRPGRLHWLAGRRSRAENWDAFEAPDGMPWTEAARQPVAWNTVRTWLLDLGRELSAAEQDHTLPTLSPARLWLRANGRLILLDHKAPFVVATLDNAVDAVNLVSAVARPALAAADSGMVIPLTVREMVGRWQNAPPPSIAELTANIQSASLRPASVVRWRRGLPIALAGLPIVLLALAAAVTVPKLRSFVTESNMEMLGLLGALDPSQSSSGRLAQPEVRDAVERYVATVHRDALLSRSFWDHPALSGGLSRLRPIGDDIAARRAPEPDVAISELRVTIGPELAEADRRFREEILPGLASAGVIIAAVLATISATFALSLSLVSAALVPGGVVTHLLGLAVVTASGHEVSRVRSVLRTAAAWLPAIVWVLWISPSPVNRISASPHWAFAVIAALAAGAVVTLIRPNRGLHDRLTGCRVTPR